MRGGLLWLLLLLLSGQGMADSLPIQVDSPRSGLVYIRVVDSGKEYQQIGDSTPATYDAKPGERIDIRVVAPDGFFYRWVGERPNVAGPCYITVRLEHHLIWERVAALGIGIFALFLGFFLRFRKKARIESELAQTQIIELQERAASAEKVGALARTLGEYEVMGRLGAGAMGVVYKVKSPKGEIFAAKVPNEMDDRVQREAEVSASLKSPHIVECYGMVTGETNFLLFEFMDGVTLHDWLAEHPRPGLAEIDCLVTQLLKALETAHRHGIYHRDLKPENLFLITAGAAPTLKVMDFGLASSMQAARLTRTGQAMGTPIYASPEQLSGNPIDATTDLYSVGVLIYELSTGKLPWSQTDPVALTLQKYKALPQEPIELRPDLPMQWNHLVVDLLSGDARKRPRTVAEVEMRWTDGRRHL